MIIICDWADTSKNKSVLTCRGEWRTLPLSFCWTQLPNLLRLLQSKYDYSVLVMSWSWLWWWQVSSAERAATKQAQFSGWGWAKEVDTAEGAQYNLLSPSPQTLFWFSKTSMLGRNIHAGQGHKPVDRGADVYFRIHGIRKNRMRWKCLGVIQGGVCGKDQCIFCGILTSESYLLGCNVIYHSSAIYANTSILSSQFSHFWPKCCIFGWYLNFFILLSP